MPDGTQVAEVPEAEVLTVKDYKSEVKPIWCPGCGDFGVLSATYKALATLQLQRHDVVVVAGIGCSSRTPYFMSTFGLSTACTGAPYPSPRGLSWRTRI